MKTADVLAAATAAVSKRPDNYGAPRKNFEQIARLWNAHLSKSVRVTPTDVAIMMALVKIARLQNDPTHDDSWIDLAGYAACGSEVSEPPSKLEQTKASLGHWIRPDEWVEWPPSNTGC